MLDRGDLGRETVGAGSECEESEEELEEERVVRNEGKVKAPSSWPGAFGIPMASP